jgi:hypothetical protein
VGDRHRRSGGELSPAGAPQGRDGLRAARQRRRPRVRRRVPHEAHRAGRVGEGRDRADLVRSGLSVRGLGGPVHEPRAGEGHVLARDRTPVRQGAQLDQLVRRPAGAGCFASYLDSQSFTFRSDAAEYLPASKFREKYQPYGFQFEVWEMREPGPIPCP